MLKNLTALKWQQHSSTMVLGVLKCVFCARPCKVCIRLKSPSPALSQQTEDYHTHPGHQGPGYCLTFSGSWMMSAQEHLESQVLSHMTDCPQEKIFPTPTLITPSLWIKWDFNEARHLVTVTTILASVLLQQSISQTVRHSHRSQF